MGILYTPKLFWTKAKMKFSCQARTFVYAIKIYKKQFGKFCFDECFKIFDTMVKSILLFGSEIWGTQLAVDIEKV